ncbi:MAG: transporter substrate-binding domain-containing protein, partial [Bacteroidota bacterium]
WSVVTMTTVGYGDKTPKSRGGKIIALIWMFSGLLFISGITASIASTLTVNQLSASSAELADFKDRPIGTIAQTSSANYLRDRFFRDIHLYPSVAEALDALLAKEIAAFCYDDPIVRHYLGADKRYARLTILPEKFNVQFYAFATPKQKDDRLMALDRKLVEITERTEWQEVLREFNCIEE